MSRRFEGKLALVTGAGGGIGRALALGIAAEGADVACLDISSDAAADTASQVEAAGVRSLAQTCDVSVEPELTSAVERIEAELGAIDVLLANAGGTRSESIPFLELTMDRWHTMVDRNLTSAFVSCLVVGRHMARHGGGAIVVVASQLGEVVRKNMAHYCSAKGGVKQLIRAAAVDLVEHGIRVNGIAPGPTMTPGTRELFERPDIAELNRRIIPLGRIADAEEVVGGALYLASDEASFAVGTTLIIDGGYTIV